MADFTVAAPPRLTPLGALGFIHSPLAPAPIPEAVLAALPEAEAEEARRRSGYRQVDFVAGRLALREAARCLGAEVGPVLPGDEGQPQASGPFSVSLSHKRGLAVGLVGRAEDGTLGVDLEGGDGRERLSVAGRVLRPDEVRVLESLPPGERWPYVQRVFSVKEAIYKAVYPRLRRYVGFQEASVEVGPGGRARVSLLGMEGLEAEASWEELPGGFVLALVRVKG